MEVEKSEMGWTVKDGEETIGGHNHQVGDGEGGTVPAVRSSTAFGSSSASKGMGKGREDDSTTARKRRVVESDSDGESSSGLSSVSDSGSGSGSESGSEDGSVDETGPSSISDELGQGVRGGYQQPREASFDFNHPRLSKLKPEIDRLTQVDLFSSACRSRLTFLARQLAPLDFPSVSNGIKDVSYTKLRVLILAAAKQRGFTLALGLNRVTRHERRSGSFFGLMCSKVRSRSARKSEHERCGFKVILGKGSDGRWSVVREALEHTHPLDDGITFDGDKRANAVSPVRPRSLVLRTSLVVPSPSQSPLVVPRPSSRLLNQSPPTQ